MYCGVRAHHDATPVASYAQAQRTLAEASRTPTGKQRAEKPNGFPLGGHSKSVCWVREDSDQSIAFTLYDTDVVTWHPDNSVVIDNYGTTTTSGFARRFLPEGIYLNHPVERRGVSGGARTITYRSAAPDYRWSICQGGLVCFREHGDLWLPDEDTLDEMRFPELDLAEARMISRVHHLTDFANFLSMAPRHMRIEHEEWDLAECGGALFKRDFVQATKFLPLVTPTNAFGRDSGESDLGVVTKRWDEAGAFTTMSARTMPTKEFDRRMRRVRQLRDVCNVGWDLGPTR